MKRTESQVTMDEARGDAAGDQRKLAWDLWSADREAASKFEFGIGDFDPPVWDRAASDRQRTWRRSPDVMEDPCRTCWGLPCFCPDRVAVDRRFVDPLSQIFEPSIVTVPADPGPLGLKPQPLKPVTFATKDIKPWTST